MVVRVFNRVALLLRSLAARPLWVASHTDSIALPTRGRPRERLSDNLATPSVIILTKRELGNSQSLKISYTPISEILAPHFSYGYHLIRGKTMAKNGQDDIEENAIKAPSRVWTLEAFTIHTTSMQAAQERFDNERDRRYAEVALEREKALKIKETADLAALQLAREIQEYKDEKANELRSQIERERLTYTNKDDLKQVVEKFEASMAPVANYVVGQIGREKGIGMSAAVVNGLFLAAVAGVGLLVVLLR